MMEERRSQKPKLLGPRSFCVEVGNTAKKIVENLKSGRKRGSVVAVGLVSVGGVGSAVDAVSQRSAEVVASVPAGAQSTDQAETIISEAKRSYVAEEVVAKTQKKTIGRFGRESFVSVAERDVSELEKFRLIQIRPDEYREVCEVVYNSTPEEWQALGTSFEKEGESLWRWGRGLLGGSPLPGKGAMLVTDKTVELLEKKGIDVEDCSDRFRLVEVREGEKPSQVAIRCGYTPGSLAMFNGALNPSHLDRSSVGVLIVPSNLPQWEIKTGFGGPILKTEEVLVGVERTMQREFSEGHQVIELSAVVNSDDEAIPVMVVDSRLVRVVNSKGEQVSLKRVDGKVHAGVVGETLWEIKVKRMESVHVYMGSDIPIEDPTVVIDNRNGNPVRWVNLATGEEGIWGEWPPVTVITVEPTKEPTPEPTEQIVVSIEQGKVDRDIDFTDRAQVTWNPDGAGPEGVQKALLRVAAELNRTTVEQIRQDLEQGKQVLCPVTHYKFDDKGNLVYTQPVDDEWDLSKPVEIKFVDNNWGGGRSSGRRIVIDVVDGSLVLKIWTRIDEQVLNNEWRGTTSVLEALWRVLLKGTQSSEDPLRVERMKDVMIDLAGAWGSEAIPLIDIKEN